MIQKGDECVKYLVTNTKYKFEEVLGLEAEDTIGSMSKRNDSLVKLSSTDIARSLLDSHSSFLGRHSS